MLVQVNGRYLVQRVTGVQRYAREIVARLGDRVSVIAPRSAAKGMRGHLWEQAVLPCRLRRGLLWSPSATGPLAVRSQVVTIHDCAFFDRPEGFTQTFAAWYRCLVPRLARQARRILTVSEFSRQRICEVCRVPAERVVVIPNGVESGWTRATSEQIAAARERLNLPRPFVLCAGSLEPRKNLRRLLAAWRALGPAKEGLELVLAGAEGHVFQRAGLGDLPGDVRLVGYVSDADLRALFSAAEAFVFPSLYEGFGLPVLEALACGTPVVCSRGTSLPEVAGDAAVYVDPENVESIAAGIAQLLENRALRDDLSRRGPARATPFTWDAAAAQTWEALRTAL
ncbi:MAG: glycosyltransferase family 1 protein [Pirellulaceae bacterium]|nr:glycosyltransferase family 1 protein [Pirellulaceae bacterium]